MPRNSCYDDGAATTTTRIASTTTTTMTASAAATAAAGATNISRGTAIALLAEYVGLFAFPLLYKGLLLRFCVFHYRARFQESRVP